MFEHVAHLRRLRQQVDRVHADAGPERTEQELNRAQAVRHYQRNRVAAGHAAAAQQRRNLAAACGEGTERELLFGFDRERVDGVRPGCGLAFDQLANRRGRRRLLSRHCARCHSVRRVIGRHLLGRRHLDTTRSHAAP